MLEPFPECAKQLYTRKWVLPSAQEKKNTRVNLAALVEPLYTLNSNSKEVSNPLTKISFFNKILLGFFTIRRQAMI